MSFLEIVETSPSGPLAFVATALKRLIKPSQEKFSSNNDDGSAVGGAFVGMVLVMWMVNLFITFFSFYLAFKCISKGGNPVGHLLGACCCGVFYTAYALANGCMN